MRPAGSSLHLDAGRDLSGGQRQLLDLLCGLQKRGHRVLLCCPRSAPLFVAGTARGVPCWPLTLRSGFDFPSAVRLARLVGGGGYDVVHAHDAASYSIAHAAQGISRHPALREGLYVTCRESGGDAGPLERERYDEPGSHYLTSSRRVRDQLLRRGADPGRVLLVPSGVDIERTAAARRREGADPWGFAARGLRVVGWVGRLVRRENPGLLVDAFARLARRMPEAHLLIVGEGPMRSALLQRLEQLQIAARATLVGHPDDVAAAYGAMDVFVVTSELEGNTTGLLDAMSAGVPVVATACTDILELLRHGDSALVVPPSDSEVLSDALARVLEQPDLAARLVEGSTRQVRQHSIDVLIDALLAAYQRSGTDGRDGHPPPPAAAEPRMPAPPVRPGPAAAPPA